MTESKKIELVVDYMKGALLEEVAEKYGISVAAARYTLQHVYKRRRSGRRINVDDCVYPKLARWLNESGLSAAWLADRLGVTKQAMHHYLHGEIKIPEHRKKEICAVTRLSYKQAFGKEAEC